VVEDGIARARQGGTKNSEERKRLRTRALGGGKPLRQNLEQSEG